MLGLFMFGTVTLLIWLIGWLARSFGVVQFGELYGGMLLPLTVMVIIGVMLVLGLAGRGLRKLTIPLSEILQAVERIADGDYTIRVGEGGPAEMRFLARAFNRMAGRLQASAEQRRSLLADVTHELRTPLTILQGNLEGMLDGVYPPDEKNLRSLLDETQIMARLVDDLRTLALAESGALELRKETTDIALLMTDIVMAFQPQAQGVGISLSIQTPESPILLMVDPARLRQVISNLLSNALRYTPAGGTVRLDLDMTRTAGETQAVLRIIDNGRGISAADLAHIFERFYRSSDSGGMGLGLAIARSLVDAHSGTLTASSVENQGTVMEIRLPG